MLLRSTVRYETGALSAEMGDMKGWRLIQRQHDRQRRQRLVSGSEAHRRTERQPL